jgi:hypothetical protein
MPSLLRPNSSRLSLVEQAALKVLIVVLVLAEKTSSGLLRRRKLHQELSCAEASAPARESCGTNQIIPKKFPPPLPSGRVFRHRRFAAQLTVAL